MNTDDNVQILGRTLTHITRLSHPHTLVHRLSLQSAPDNEILVLDLVELFCNLVQSSRLPQLELDMIYLILHRFDFGRVKRSSGQTKVRQLDMSC